MPDFRINDDWILNRISSQSNSFSQWVDNLVNLVKKSLENAPPEIAEQFKKINDLNSLKDLDKQLSKAEKEITLAQNELSKLGGLGKTFSNFGMKIIEQIQIPIEKEIKKSLQYVKGLDLIPELDFITGKRKDLSTALYDVSKERGIESEGLLYLIRALPDLEAFLYSTSVKKYYRDHTEHALRVAVLGDFLLEQDLGQGSIEGIISELTELDKTLLKDKFWWITGLIHDIGYPL